MKLLLRSFIFSIIALIVTIRVINGYQFAGNSLYTFLYVSLGLTLLNLLLSPIFDLISLPSSGVLFLILSVAMTIITLHALNIFIAGFDIVPANISKAVIFGVDLPAKKLTLFWSTVYSALLYSLTYNFFSWLCKVKK
ncbi:MAG: hypothetical protein R3B92_03405 [Patescibacteria group bacterium]|uniref:Phage holin family protein n=1 Tax=candidate division WWE3 bacterium TaxID=2053526 RepID=A0A955EDF2_UNCKA|nr:hypothetical protein [candidate division WWE3 bacterium]